MAWERRSLSPTSLSVPLQGGSVCSLPAQDYWNRRWAPAPRAVGRQRPTSLEITLFLCFCYPLVIVANTPTHQLCPFVTQLQYTAAQVDRQDPVILHCIVSTTWASICVQHWGQRPCRVSREGVTLSNNGDLGYYPRKCLKILYPKPCILGNICAIIGPQNRSILLCWILLLRCFWINFFIKQLYNYTVSGKK